MNDLDRVAFARGKGRPQAFVTGNQFSECPFQGRSIKWTTESERNRNVICRVVWLKLIEKPQALLRKRQAIPFGWGSMGNGLGGSSFGLLLF